MNKTANKIEVSIGSALEYLDLVQTVTDSITSFMGFDEDTAHWIGMSVRESVTNAIQHGNNHLDLFQGKEDRLYCHAQSLSEG